MPVEAYPEVSKLTVSLRLKICSTKEVFSVNTVRDGVESSNVNIFVSIAVSSSLTTSKRNPPQSKVVVVSLDEA